MLWTIFIRELKSQLKSPAFYIFAGLLAFGTALFISETRPGVTFLYISFGKEWHNAPIIIAKLLASYSLVGVLFTMIMVGRAVAKDFSAGIHEFFFTSPIKKIEYLGGRFLGGLAANLLIFSAVLLGFFIAGLRLPAGYYGPFRLWSFVLPTLVIVLPNLILTGSVFFGLASLTRKMVNTYVAGVVFFLAYVLTSLAFMKMDNDLLKMLTDPFAISALNTLTKFWTVAEMNVNPMPLDPRLLLNRAIWLIVAVAVLYLTWRKFKLISVLEGRKQSGKADEPPAGTGTVRSLEPLAESKLDYSFSCRRAQFLNLAGREFRRIGLHPAFIILTFMAMGEIFTNFLMNVNEANNEVYPFTSFFLQYTSHIWIYMIPITILFGGLIVWRERDNRSHEFYDTMPVPHGVSLGAKLAALLSIQFCYVLIAMMIGIVVQAGIIGFYDIEPMLYLKGLFGIEFMKFAFMAVLVVFIQNLSPNKYVGFFISTAYFLGDLALYEMVKTASPLFRYGHIPKYIYSNLNGYGHYGPMIIWYTAYWLLFAALLLLITSLLWRHGNESSPRHRFRQAREKIRPLQAVSMIALTVLFLSTGSYIYCNRHILNKYLSDDGRKEMQAAYEKKFAAYRNAPQPEMVDVELQIDLFPERRQAVLKGTYRLVNMTDSAISEIFVNLSDQFVTGINRLSFDPPAQLSRGPEEFGFRIFKLQQPLQPGDTVKLGFDLEAFARGFTDNNPKDEIAANGSCIIFSGAGGNTEYFPGIGFNKDLILTESYDRKKCGLPEKSPLPALEESDPAIPYGNNRLVTFEAVISTVGDQTVVSNGDLVRQWQENGRNHFHYRSDVPIHDEFIIASGRYQVARDTHAGVAIEVYHDAKHTYNVGRMIKGVKGGLDLCSKAFSPYPYAVQRIVEIPDYMEEGGARSQPTVFIWRESAGFVSNLDKPDRADGVFGIAAHELGHQWWAYIVCPAYAEGLYLPTENICQYVWAMCLEKEYGKAMSRKFLKQEMEAYLRRRKRDTKGERPLMRSLEGQDYLGYQKGGLSLYALQDYIGEENVNRALGNIVRKFGFRRDLYVTSRDMVEEFRAAAPESLQYVVEDLFQTITIYENKALSAEARKMEDGSYQITLTVEAKKFRADSIGNQSEIPTNDYVYLGVLDENGGELYLRKHRITANPSTFEITVNGKPAQAGIDPHLILIDRNREDNLVKVKGY
jgi:ABC-2 type transport system permease protein